MAYKRNRTDFEADLQRQDSPFVFYGTPLPPLDDHSRDDGSYVPVWKQEVTDDRGRKRLHGAFTGGFSAGYFNTVGSKEGWTPSAFVSSRTNRASTRNQAQQRPEDFMDEEDIREQEESRQLLANQNFSGFGTADDEGHKNALMDLFRPKDDTVGLNLLNKMGWKHGQGIGPRVKRKTDPEDSSTETHFFAPSDVPMLSLVKKTDYKGVGYASNSPLASSMDQPSLRKTRFGSNSDNDEDEGRPGLSFASNTKKQSKPKRGAFGVGILNDTGSDDEDPYSLGPSISYNKTLGGEKRGKKSKTTSSSTANPLLEKPPVFVPKKINSISNALRKCHDGRLPLDGFVLADELDTFSTLSLSDDKYKVPPVPEGWKPSRVAGTAPISVTIAYQSTSEAAKSSKHTSSTRGNLLGESALPGKSVFDFLTPAAREKLMQATGKKNLPPALNESLPGMTTTSASQDTTVEIPSLDPQTALQALSRMLHGGFTPYNNDPAKANRYKAYLESQANTTTTTPPPLRPQGTRQEEFLIELHEFARTAEVFKPVSGLIASRFTTSTSTSQPSTTTDSSDLLSKPASRPKDPAEEAARVGMFGPLTRSVGNFYPTRLLCKRFGVPMPDHGDGASSTNIHSGTTAAAPAKPNVVDRFPSGGVQHEDGGFGSRTGADSTSSVGETTQLAIQRADPTSLKPVVPTDAVIDPDKNEAIEQERPGAAVFRAIFGSDDEDED